MRLQETGFLSDHARWQKQIEETLRCLHQRQGYAENEDWKTIASELVGVGDGRAWLEFVTPVRLISLVNEEASNMNARRDMEAVAEVFRL